MRLWFVHTHQYLLNQVSKCLFIFPNNNLMHYHHTLRNSSVLSCLLIIFCVCTMQTFAICYIWSLLFIWNVFIIERGMICTSYLMFCWAIWFMIPVMNEFYFPPKYPCYLHYRLCIDYSVLTKGKGKGEWGDEN